MRAQPTERHRLSNSGLVVSQTLDGFDPEAMEETVRPGFQRMQLGSGRFSGSFLRAHLGASRVDWGQYSLPLLATGAMPAENLILALVFDFRMPGRLNGHTLTSATPVLLTEGAALHYQLPPYSQWFTFHVPRQLAETAGLSLPDDYAAPLATDPGIAESAAIHVKRMLATLRGISQSAPDVPDPEAYLRHLEVELLDVFSATTAGIPRAGRRSGGHRAENARLVRRAVEIIDARLHEALSISQVCREVNCDWKRLERSFKAVAGIPPKRFLTLARLSRARQLLLRAAPHESVTSIAGRCGIHHLGRFSIAYRTLFGELPSATLTGRRK